MKKNAHVEIHYETPVWVNPTTEKIRKEECLCLNCTKLQPGTVNNCRIAQKLYGVCLAEKTALIITRCPEYQPKTLVSETETQHIYKAPGHKKESEAEKGAKNYLGLKGESGGPVDES